MKTRTLPNSNYRAFYINGKTLRLPIDAKRPVTELEYPEFYDVKITNKCFGACPYCYQSSAGKLDHFNNVPEKIQKYFGAMTPNERPFQVAIGGGEPTLHPEFREICKTFKELGIDPNYTTNGTNLTDEVLDITEEFVNGVAVSCHEHLPWEDGVAKLNARDIYTNLHIIISDDNSVRRFAQIYEQFKGKIQHFVLLPMISQGRSDEEFAAWDSLKALMDSFDDHSDVAFGALFHPYLSDLDWDISIYEPEAFSRYLVMDDAMREYRSSFSTERN